MLALFVPVLSWLLRTVVIKFVFLVVLAVIFELFIPVVIGYVSPFITAFLQSSGFSGLDAGVWWVLDLFNISFGVPLVLSAYVSRFLIRRIPFIG